MHSSALIRSMWSLEGPAAETGLEGVIVPDAHVEFVFHLGAVWRMRRCRNPEWVLQPSAFLYAQQRGGIELQPLGHSSLVAFRVSGRCGGFSSRAQARDRRTCN